MFYGRLILVLVSAVCIAVVGTPPTKQTKKNAPSAALTGYTEWIPMMMVRDKLIPPVPTHRDFNDQRYEYRWKSERIVNDDICTIELRPADDVEGSELLPFVVVHYSNPNGHGRAQGFIREGVRMGSGKGHAFLTAKDCADVDIVAWGKAEDLPRMKGVPPSK
jgi:hypothetical protein